MMGGNFSHKPIYRMTNILQKTFAPSWLSEADCPGASIDSMPEAKRLFVQKANVFLKAVYDCKRMGGTRRYELNFSFLETYLWAVNYLHKIQRHVCRNYGIIETDAALTEQYNKTATLEYTNAYGATVTLTINYRQ